MLISWLTVALLSVPALPTPTSPPAVVSPQIAQTMEATPDTATIWEAAALGLTATTLAQLGEVEEALAIARSLDNPEIQTDVFSRISRILAEQGETEQALDLLKRIPDLNPDRLLGYLASELANQDNWTAIAQLKEQVDDPAFTLTLVQILAEAGETERALEFYNTLPEPPSPQRLVQLALVFAQQENFATALDLAATLDPSLEKAVSLAEIARIQAETGQNANSLFQEAIDLTESLDPSTQRTQVLAQIALSLAKVGEFEQAFALRDNLPNGGNKSEMPYYFAYYLAEDGQFDRALEIAQEIKTDPNLYSSLMREIALLFAETGEVERALALTEPLPSRDYVQGRIAVTLANHGEVQRAVALAQTLPLPSQWEILSQIAQTVASEGEQALAESLFLEALATLPAEETGGPVTLQIAQQMLYAGFTERAIAFLEKLNSPQLRSELLRELVAQLSDNEEYSRAISLLSNEENPDHKTAGLSILAFSLSQKNNPQLAQVLAAADTLSNPHQQAVIYSTAAYQFALDDKPQQARELLDRVLTLTTPR
ncbi:MAG: hypothetical protein F6K03_01390 [Kamptonema sp. SIO4C4]|nr:hypothetical protein [Kamptonema sp. SIO4C4]